MVGKFGACGGGEETCKKKCFAVQKKKKKEQFILKIKKGGGIATGGTYPKSTPLLKKGERGFFPV